MEESKRPQFKCPISEKSTHVISKKADPHPKILGQPNLYDINRPWHTISVIMAPGFGKTPITDFMPIELIDTPAVIQPHNLQAKFQRFALIA